MNLPSKINFIDWNIELRSLINPNNNKIFTSPPVIGYKQGTNKFARSQKIFRDGFLGRDDSALVGGCLELDEFLVEFIVEDED